MDCTYENLDKIKADIDAAKDKAQAILETLEEGEVAQAGIGQEPSDHYVEAEKVVEALKTAQSALEELRRIL